jgi:hypothetical protein
MNSTTSIFPENHCPDLTFREPRATSATVALVAWQWEIRK